MLKKYKISGFLQPYAPHIYSWESAFQETYSSLKNLLLLFAQINKAWETVGMLKIEFVLNISILYCYMR